MTVNSTAHKRERQRWAPVVASGNGWCAERICLMPTRWLDPGQPWDLAHDHARGTGYLGPAHRKCNRAEGAARGNRARHPGAQPPPQLNREVL